LEPKELAQISARPVLDAVEEFVGESIPMVEHENMETLVLA
jgi:hypothetical protein